MLTSAFFVCFLFFLLCRLGTYIDETEATVKMEDYKPAGASANQGFICPLCKAKCVFFLYFVFRHIVDFLCVCAALTTLVVGVCCRFASGVKLQKHYGAKHGEVTGKQKVVLSKSKTSAKTDKL